MKQILNKLVKQKTKMNRDIGKISYIFEINREKICENIEEIKTIKRAIGNRKQRSKMYADLPLRTSEL